MCTIIDSKKSKSTKSPCSSGNSGTIKERKPHSCNVEDVNNMTESILVGEKEIVIREKDGRQEEREETSRVMESETKLREDEGTDEGGKVVEVENMIGRSYGEVQKVDVEQLEQDGERKQNVTEGNVQYTADNDINDDTVVRGLEHTITEVVMPLETAANDDGIRCSPIDEHHTQFNDSQSPAIQIPVSPGEGPALNIVNGENVEEVITSVLSEEEEDEGPLDSSMEELASSPSLTLNPVITTNETEGKLYNVRTLAYITVDLQKVHS